MVCALCQGAPAIGVVGRSRELSWASDQLKSCIISEVVECCVESSRYEVEPELASALRAGALEAPSPVALLATKLEARNSAASCKPLAGLARRARLWSSCRDQATQMVLTCCTHVSRAHNEACVQRAETLRATSEVASAAFAGGVVVSFLSPPLEIVHLMPSEPTNAPIEQPSHHHATTTTPATPLRFIMVPISLECRASRIITHSPPARGRRE